MVSLREVTIIIVSQTDQPISAICKMAVDIASAEHDVVVDIHVCPREEVPEEDYVKAALKEKKRLEAQKAI